MKRLGIYLIAVFVRTLIIYLLLIPAIYIFDILAYPFYAYIITVILDLILFFTYAFILVTSQPSKTSKKLILLPCLTLSTLIGMYKIHLLPVEAFNIILGILGLSATLGVAMICVLAGEPVSIVFQRISLGIAILSPIFLGLIDMFSGDAYGLYRLATIISNASSLTNFLFNKDALSVGLPPLFRAVNDESRKKIKHLKKHHLQ